MRHKLLYLLALALTATSSGWGQDVGTLVYSKNNGKLSKIILPQTPSNAASEGIESCFANGYPVRVYLNQNLNCMVVETIEADNGTPDSFTFKPGQFSVYGGSLGKPVESTSITLESGSVRSIFGGGLFVGTAGTGKTTQAVAEKYSYKDKNGNGYTPESADVKDTANIIIKKGAVIENLLLGGGRYYAKTNTVNIEAEGATIATVYAGGYDQGQTTNTPDTDIDASVNGVRNVNMTFTGCTITEGLGTGGGQGYTHTGTSEVTVADSDLGAIYGTLANGYADDIKVTVTNSTFKKQFNGTDVKYRELGSINRGGVGNVSFTFDGCSFEEPENIIAGLGAVDGWANSDTNGKPLPTVTGKVSYKLINSHTETPTFSVGRGLDKADVELTGAKASLRHFVDGNKVPEGLSEFTLSADKTWTFNDGLIIGKDVTFNKYGKLVSAITAEEQAEQTIDQKAIKPYDVYANGTPIEITAYSTDSVKITKQGETTVAFKVPSISSVYAGAKESPVASTSIKMTSGKIWNLYGGGRSEKKDSPANVSGTASIEMAQGTTVSNLLVGGGYWYSKADKIDVDLQGATVQFFCVGGFDQGKTTNRIDTPLENSVNGANTVDIHMNGGSIYVMGCGGGQGYSLTGESTVTLEGGTVIDYFYGTYSNGHADKITVNATNCTFKSELATINRGQVGKSFFTFDQCSFGDQSNTAMIASLGAADGWADSDTNGKILPIVSDSVSYTFTGSKTAVPDMKLSRGLENADVEVTGARVLMTYFRDGTAVGNTTTDFILNTGKTWTFNGGLKCEGDKYTFTKQGILKATAPEASDLLTLAGVHADTISLVEATYELPSQLTITKPMALTGAGMDKTFIKAGAADWAHTYDADLNLISIENAADITPAEGGEVVISNLTASNAKRIGLNVQTSMAVKLDAVTLKDNPAAGLVVHSKVEATDMHTSGNTWGGVNIDKGTPAYSTLCFTFDANSTFAEKAPVYSELYDQEKIVVVPDDSWERLVQMSDESKGVAMWLKRLIVPAGQTLTADATYANRNVYIENTGILNVTAPLALAKVTMEEGAQLIPALTDNNKVTATTLQLNTTLKEDKWTAFGFPKAFTLSTADGQTTYAEPTKDTKADKGAYFAGLKDNTAPVFEYKDAFGTSGLLSANTGDWQVSATDVEFKAEAEPDAPTTPTFILYANPNTYDMPLTKNKSVYVFDAASNEFVQCTDATKTLKPFESVIITDASTYSTLRSLRLGDNIVTGTQTIEPVEGYYVSTERGAIVIHTAEPVQVLIVEMSGRIAYTGMATDGQRIMVPTGIYAVNGQLVRVK